MRTHLTITTFAFVLGCGTPPSSSSNGSPDASAGSNSGGVVADASGAHDGAALDAGADPSHFRTSLASCWTDPSCARALLVAHGGEWNLASPAYGSTAAYDAAFADAADAIKADVRFSSDGVPVVVHSSPFQAYEIDPIDFDCLGKRVEHMTAADIVGCRWINGDHIQRLDSLLAWARGKTIIMLTIKDVTTTPQVIGAIIAQQATDFVFLEVPTATMTTVVPTVEGNAQVYFVVEAASQTDITALLALHHPRAFLYEDANGDNFGGMAPAAVTAMISSQLHPAHVRAFSSISSISASASDHQQLWNLGFDVVMTNSYGAGHSARMATNTARAVSPP